MAKKKDYKKVEKFTRGIDKEGFIDAFMKSPLYELYKENKDELFIGIRNNYLNLYYNCDSIARVEYKNNSIICFIDKYYLTGKHYKAKDKEKNYKAEPIEIYNKYQIIKEHSQKKKKKPIEKWAQSKLIINNNKNTKSKWYCIDIEYANKNSEGRFDIIAISKESPFKVALIELKYGNKAIGGKSGIFQHIKDFKKFHDSKYFKNHLKKEIVDIIGSLKELDIKLPFDETPSLENIDSKPEFYFITLNNNAKTKKGSTPKETMGGYLFKDKRWGSKKFSTEHNVQKKLKIDVLDKNNPFNATFLFSKETIDNITINDIIDGNYDDKEPK